MWLPRFRCRSAFLILAERMRKLPGSPVWLACGQTRAVTCGRPLRPAALSPASADRRRGYRARIFSFGILRDACRGTGRFQKEAAVPFGFSGFPRISIDVAFLPSASRRFQRSLQRSAVTMIASACTHIDFRPEPSVSIGGAEPGLSAVSQLALIGLNPHWLRIVLSGKQPLCLMAFLIGCRD